MVGWYLAWVTQLRDQMVTAGRFYRQAKTLRSTVGRELGRVARVARKAGFRAAGMKRQAEVVRPSRRRRVVVVQGVEQRREEPGGEEPAGEEPGVEEPGGEEPAGDEASSETPDDSSSDDSSANVVEAA